MSMVLAPGYGCAMVIRWL